MNRFKKIQTIAWFIMIAAFFTCLGLAGGTPVSVRWFIRNAQRPLKMVLQPRAGTVTLREPGQSVPVLVPNDVEVMAHQQIKLSSDDAEALLLFYHPDDLNADPPGAPIITVQLYGQTDLILESARTPQFAVSTLPNQVTLQIQRGPNTRITIESDGRATTLHAQSPHGRVQMEEGSFAIKVEESQTVFSVSTGQAHVLDPESGEMVILTDPLSIEITAGKLGDTYAGERDLLRNRNGNFEQPLEGTWRVYTDVGDPEETSGQVRQTLLNGRQAALFTRVGRQFAKTGVEQAVGQDIRGAKSLRVRARVLVDLQSLGVCGTLGTECPVMIRFEYTDQQGTSGREWLQGFYAIQDENYEPFCQICGWKAQHQQVAQLGAWYDYESPDLLPLFRAQGIEPATIDLVQVYASGHTYSAAVDEIAILVGE